MTRIFHPRNALIASRVALGAFFIAVCLSPSWHRGPFVWFPLYWLDLAGETYAVGLLFALPIIAWMLWAVARARTPSRPSWRWGRWPVAVPVFAFGMLALLRSWPIHVPRTAVIVALSVALFWMIYAYTLQAGSMHWVVTVLSVVILIQGVVAVAQFLAQRSLGLTWLGELSLIPEVRGVSVVEAAGQRWLRAYGLTGHPNVLGGHLGVGLLVCLGALPSASTSRRYWLGLCIIGGGLGLFATFSRSAWLGTFTGLVYWLVVIRFWRRLNWRASRTRWVAATVSVAIVVGALVLVIGYGELIQTRLSASGSELESNSLRERERDLKQAWGLVRQVPFKGVGTGYYVEALWSNVGDKGPPAFQHVHNIPLLVAAEMGIGGALLWLWLLGGPVLEGMVKVNRWPEKCQIELASYAAAFVVLFVVALFDSYLYFPMTRWPAFYIGILTGIWARPLCAVVGGSDG